VNRTNRRASVDPLELRRLLTIVPVVGTEAADVIHVGLQGASPLAYVLTVNGVQTTGSFNPFHEDNAFDIQCLGGDDLVTVDPLFGAQVRAAGGEGNDTLDGSSGFDTLLGNGGLDVLLGRAGPDVLVGGAGRDTLRGGADQDKLAGDRHASWDLTSKSAGDVLVGDEDNDEIYGGGGNDWIEGNDGFDELTGGDGDDRLFGGADGDMLHLAVNFDDPSGNNAHGAGNDILDGDEGHDELVVNSPDQPISVTLDGLANDGALGEEANVLQTFERVASNTLAAGSIIDATFAPIGIDFFFEGLGSPTTGTHVTFVGSGFDDTFSTNGRGGDDSLPLFVAARGGHDRIQGGFVNDTLYGGKGNDSIWGFAGDDLIVAEDGHDTIEGGAGNDYILGQGGNDEAYGDDVSIPSVDYGRDTIEGGAGNDLLFGNAGADRLFGNGRSDTLWGNGGNDQLYGGPTTADEIHGGIGTDAAAADEKDTFEFVEVMLT